MPVDYSKASKYVDRDARRLVCEALFELFDKVSGKVDDFDFDSFRADILQFTESLKEAA